MTGMPKRGERPRTAAILAFERETDEVRAEYRRRERQERGSGDGWLAQRTDVLRQMREGRPAKFSTGLLHRGSASGDPQHAGTRNGRASTKSPGGLSRLWGGVS